MPRVFPQSLYLRYIYIPRQVCTNWVTFAIAKLFARTHKTITKTNTYYSRNKSIHTYQLNKTNLDKEVIQTSKMIYLQPTKIKTQEFSERHLEKNKIDRLPHPLYLGTC